MEPLLTGIVGIVAVFLLLFLRMPIAYALMLVGFVGTAYMSSTAAALSMVPRTLFGVSSFYAFTVIPLFVAMGCFAEQVGMIRNIYDAFDKWFRKLPGGLAITTIGASAGFAAVSGSSVATAAAIGTCALPEMRKFGYSPRLATGSIAAGGTLGWLIPPSVGFIIYAMLTEQSVGKLLIAGIIPGFLLAAAYISIIIIWVKINPSLARPTEGEISWHEKLAALKKIWSALVTFLLVVGGMYLGFFTPTEAAAIGATILFIINLARGRLTLVSLNEALRKTVQISVMILLLVAGANVFSFFLALSTLPMVVTQWVTNLNVSPYLVVAIISIIYLFMGCFLDGVSIMVMTMPVIYPIVTGLQFDPIWFGVIVMLMMEAGLITPPMGLNVFAVAGVAGDVPLEEIFKGIAPFLISILFVAFLVALFPAIALFLPSMMIK
jgi:tripartite ATP-independent transporter DctM subunit